jgi:hypothetical protein
MTTIVKVRLECPHCGRQWGDYSTTSTNGIGWRQRSDGYGEGHYHVPETALRVCNCGGLFLAHQHRTGDDERGTLTWSRKPDFEELERVSAAGQFESDEFELELTGWLYWIANHAPWAAGDRDRIVRSQDLPRLLTLLQTLASPPLLLAGQILRDLGRFDEAVELYKSLPGHAVGRTQLIELGTSRRPDLVWLLSESPPQPHA